MNSSASPFRRRLMLAYKPPMPDYLCFTALEGGEFNLTIPSGLTVANLSYVEYSTDEGATWTRTDNVADTAVTITTPTVNAGDKVYWRGSGIRYASSTSVYSMFSATCRFNTSGHLNSLCYLKAVGTNTVHSYTYFRLFYNCTKLVSAEELVMPSATETYSNGGMFRGCTALSISPKLSALHMGTNCYREMFYSCTSLTKLVNLSTSRGTTNSYYLWMGNNSTTYVPSTCIFVANLSATDTFISDMNSRNLTVILYDTTNDKYYLSDRTTECDDYGNILGG